MEREFSDTGLAGAAVPLFLRQALGLEAAHARYMTRHDLCALTAMQLDHAGLGPVWSLLEAALLAPTRTQFARTEGGAAWRYGAGGLRAAAFGFGASARGPGATLAASARAEGFAETLLAQRRVAALLTAHGLPPAWVAADPGLDDAALEAALAAGPVLDPARIDEAVAAADTQGGRVVAIRHPMLGTAGFARVGDEADGGTQVLGRCWPLDPASARDAAQALCDAHGARREGNALALADAVAAGGRKAIAAHAPLLQGCGKHRGCGLL